jgi:NADP-reducing hydrogenase subunit HndB
MKTLAELKAIRDRMQGQIELREDDGSRMRVVVGMATCGIAAGARPVLTEFVNDVNELGLNDKITVTQTGCIGICMYEPVVEIFEPGKEKVTYVKMNAEKAKRVAKEHLQNGRIVNEYTIGAAANN